MANKDRHADKDARRDYMRKLMWVKRHQPQGLGEDFQRLHDKVEDEMDGLDAHPKPSWWIRRTWGR